MTNESSKKVAQIFRCENCDYSTSKRYNYDKHVSTLKHKTTKNTKLLTNKSSKSSNPDDKPFECNCGKIYLHQSSLWNHKQKCDFLEKQQTLSSNSFVMELLKQNSEFKELIKEQSYHMMDQNKSMLEHNKSILEQNKSMCEIISKVGHTTTHTNSHNTTNKNKFNINLFLNEHCKDAMNIMDFVNSLQLQLSDLEKVGEIGFVKGISDILVKNLKELDINKRPIHCSDLKRETLYVKDANTWEKEGGKKEKLTKMIQHVAHKNVKQLPEWQKENPEFKDSESVESEKYLKIIGESMGGSTEDEDNANYNKIIKTLAKEVAIEREKEKDAE
jgi:hypothetical protein